MKLHAATGLCWGMRVSDVSCAIRALPIALTPWTRAQCVYTQRARGAAAFLYPGGVHTLARRCVSGSPCTDSADGDGGMRGGGPLPDVASALRRGSVPKTGKPTVGIFSRTVLRPGPSTATTRRPERGSQVELPSPSLIGTRECPRTTTQAARGCRELGSASDRHRVVPSTGGTPSPGAHWPSRQASSDWIDADRARGARPVAFVLAKLAERPHKGGR